jgi:C_GCAxxG_C_C family probable redox protein
LNAPLETVAYATGFGGGGGGTGLTCGALSSAILANNMVHGRKKPTTAADRAELREKYYQRYNNIVSDFVKESGSGLCREIINKFPEGYNDDNTRPNCIRICGMAARVAVDYLQKDAEDAAKLKYDPSVVGIKNWI